MGVTKTTINEGNGPSPSAGQTVTMEYTGWLKDASKPDNKGNKYVHVAFYQMSTTYSRDPVKTMLTESRSCL